MSCEDCDKETDALQKAYFFRIENANIALYGCPKHVGIAMDKLRRKE
uniref:Uncharacterized protein n=1 Tax=viral metagenome TaxID=1070528 RepID=A0A6H2A4N4_9ZZZZ